MFAKGKKQAESANGADTSAAAQSTAAAPASGLPLFFSKPSVVEAKRHADAGIRMNIPPSFARMTNSIPLMVTEFMQAAKYYPIVFTIGEQPMPLVLVGMEKDNYFVEQDGKWKPDVYVPAYVRKYPFVFLEAADSDKLTLCVDEDAPQFTMKAGDGDMRLFDKENPSEFTRNALSFCSAIYQDNKLTREFCESLNKLDLLTPNRSKADLKDGRSISLGGFQMIDAEKLQQLPDATILEFHKKGWLPAIYFSLLSVSNWGRLADLAALAAPSEKPAPAAAKVKTNF